MLELLPIGQFGLNISKKVIFDKLAHKNKQIYIGIFIFFFKKCYVIDGS